MSRHILYREAEILNLPLHAAERANVFCPFLSLTAGETPLVSRFCLGQGSIWRPEAWGSLSLGQKALLRLWRSSGCELEASW